MRYRPAVGYRPCVPSKAIYSPVERLLGPALGLHTSPAPKPAVGLAAGLAQRSNWAACARAPSPLDARAVRVVRACARAYGGNWALVGWRCPLTNFYRN